MKRFAMTYISFFLFFFVLSGAFFAVVSFAVGDKDPIFSSIIGSPAQIGSPAHIGAPVSFGSSQTPTLPPIGSPAEETTTPQTSASSQGPSSVASPARSIGAAAPSGPRTFTEDFSGSDVLAEAGTAEESDNAHWWLNSGALFFFDNGVGETVWGHIDDQYWRDYYARDNSDETDGGLHPQNIFRLIERDQWKDYEQQVYFLVTADQMSKSRYRNESNGLLLFNRYKDENNLYYAGLRVDGAVTIKKKYKGAYYEIAHVPTVPGEYVRSKNMSLIPKNVWIGERTVVHDLSNGDVEIRLYLDIGRTGNWKLAALAIDNGHSYGGPALSQAGMAGIRTDFMDVRLSDYRISEIIDAK